jgi:2-oxoglutarate dehydrogenase E2 component (dihydrolipoamide succinyltransferase)
MRQDIVVPRMGESINEATIGQILKASGSQVKAEEEILEIETDKVNQVLYAPAAGTLRLKVAQGQAVKVGEVIGAVEPSGAASAQAPTPAAAPEKAPPPPPKAAPKSAPSAPSARQTKSDFVQGLQTAPEEPKAKPPAESAEPTPAPPPAVAAPASEEDARETRRKMSRLRRVIANRLVEAQRTAAMLTTFNEVDMTEVMALRARYKEAFIKRYGVKLGFMSFFVKAVIYALKDVPDLNSYIDADDIVHRDYYDIGIAVGTPRGLIVPVLRDCDQLTFGQIEALLEGLAKKARDGGIIVDELTGGGFTITNGGIYGSLLSTPILNPPQSGILGMHKIQERPIAKEGQIVIRPMMYLALSYDHRIVDGQGAVRFLVHVKEFLEDPARLLIEI